MHIEFRVRTLCELVLNEKAYLHPSIISLLDPYGIEVSKNALIATSANFDRAVSKYATEVAQTVLRYDCIDTTKLGQYSNMWHVHGLASALGRPILSLYPEKSDRIRPLLHKLINPRIPTDAQDQLPLIILWTRTQPMVQESMSWSPNHFVPCYDPSKPSDTNSICSCYTTHTNKSSHPHSLASNVDANPTACPSSACMVVSCPASESTFSCTPVNDSNTSSPYSSQIADTDSTSTNSSPLCQLLTEDRTVYCATPKSLQKNKSHSLAPKLDANPAACPSSACMVVSCPASESTLSCTHVNDSNTSSSCSLNSQKADANSISTSTIFDILNKVQDTRLPVGKRRSKQHSTPGSFTLLKYTKISNLSNVQSSPAVSEKIITTTSASTQTSRYFSRKKVTKRQVCSNSGSSILKYVTSNSFSTPSIVPVTITNAMPASTFKKGKHVVTQGSVQSNSVSHSASTVVPDPVAIASKHTSHSTQAFQSEVSSPHSAGMVVPDPVAIASKHTCHGVESEVSSVSHGASAVVPDLSSKHICHDTGAFQSEVSSMDLSFLNTQCSTSLASLKEETKCDGTSVKALFNLLDSGLIRASKQKCRQVPGKAASQASITDWLVKPCNDTLTDGLSDMQELIPPTENMLEHDTSIYDFSDTDLESEVSQVSHSILTPNFCTSKFHNAARNYSLTVNVLSTSDDENSSEIDMSESSPEEDHFHLMMETDSDDDTSVDDMDFDQRNDVCTHVEFLSEKYNLLPFPNLSSQWYERQNTLATKNITRRKGRDSNSFNSTQNNFNFINRSQVQGTLKENLESLNSRAMSQEKEKQHLEAIIEVGNFILSNGPVVKTQEAGNLYIQHKGLVTKKPSMEYYELFCKYLNLVQLYMFGTAYLMENLEHIESIVSSLSSVIDEETVVKQLAQDRLQGIFSPSLKYLDTHRDRQVVKGLMVELTNITFVAKLQNIQSRKGTRNASNTLLPNLEHYDGIRKTSQIVRNDLTNVQQYKLTERIISSRKLKEIRTISEGRGRKLKSQEYPELAAVLCYAFGEHDMKERGGGGLEAHPRLTTGTLYRASDNATTMKRAREILLSLAPEGFTISLSSCFNYTENFRQNSRQAKQHHFGRGVNTSLSLKKPPRTGVEQLVINLHWSTANVNLLIDSAHDKPECVTISKDAKAIVSCDIAPMQRPGPSWKRRLVLPDHTWDQSRINAITPMTFLFIQTEIIQTPASMVEHLDLEMSSTTTLHLTRTGQGVTLLNLSFYEPETTFRSLNEILFLLTFPALDCFFRDRTTGQLRKQFTFIVDNGPAEQPSCSLVQMCLCRLMKLLNLTKIIQTSFAEYHSKRNFVERVHSEENHVLSSHGPFNSKPIHQYAKPGTDEHIENMEAVAEEVRKCLVQASFGGKQLMCYRGVQPEDYVFSDEEQLQNFLSLSEDGKKHYCPSVYAANKGEILHSLHMFWDVNEDFSSEYIKDHCTIQNELLDGIRTAWLDKYTTSLYTTEIERECRRFELQPLPDYLRWFKTGELHYLPLEERALVLGPWDEIPGAFLPTKVLDLCLSVIQEPPETIIKQMSLLSWVTPTEVLNYIKKVQTQIETQLEAELEKERWRTHPLYKSNTKVQLEAECKQLKIPVTSSLAKHQLTALIVKKKGEPLPPELPHTKLYSGDITAVPTSISAINRLTIPVLRAILKHHKIPNIGIKETLVMQVFLLQHNRTIAITSREEKQIKDLINLVHKVILEQRKLHITSHVYRKRTYTLQSNNSKFVAIPSHVVVEDDLHKSLFEPLLTWLESLSRARKQKDDTAVFRPRFCGISKLEMSTEEDNLTENIKQTGSKIKVLWSAEEVGDSGWKPGWYPATVQKYCEETDILTVVYLLEPGICYEEELSPLTANKKIKLEWAAL